MIEIVFEPFCCDCPKLEPIVERAYGYDKIVQQIITCTNIHQCRSIAEYVRKCEMEGEKDET